MLERRRQSKDNTHLARRNTPTDIKLLYSLYSLFGRHEQCSEQDENASSLFQSSPAKRQHKVIIPIPFGRHDKASVRGQSQVLTLSSMPPGYEKMTMWCKERRTRIQSGRGLLFHTRRSHKKLWRIVERDSDITGEWRGTGDKSCNHLWRS